MGGAASIIDPSHIKSFTFGTSRNTDKSNLAKEEEDEKRKEDSQAQLDRSKSKGKEKEEETNEILAPDPPTQKQGGSLVSVGSENFSIFEEPVVETDLEGLDRSESAEEGKEIKEEGTQIKRLSRNILSGEIQGNVLRAQFSMRTISTTTCTNEYLLKPEGNKPHPTSPADLRKSMQAKLSNELMPAKSLSSIEGLPELKNKKNPLETFTSLPNLSSNSNNSMSINRPPIPPIGKPFSLPPLHTGPNLSPNPNPNPNPNTNLQSAVSN